ncbi:Protein Wnt-5 [Frankliniella fusca]|uniref:Protein Wnt-5 n=1 Tax=Frankliniella fusca TaxID=407009 RepID=A0AAE1LBR9_9NEOP|nr:Protein Wnt-5 [Frankliniella fusca]
MKQFRKAKSYRRWLNFARRTKRAKKGRHPACPSATHQTTLAGADVLGLELDGGELLVDDAVHADGSAAAVGGPGDGGGDARGAHIGALEVAGAAALAQRVSAGELWTDKVTKAVSVDGCGGGRRPCSPGWLAVPVEAVGGSLTWSATRATRATARIALQFMVAAVPVEEGEMMTPLLESNEWNECKMKLIFEAIIASRTGVHIRPRSGRAPPHFHSITHEAPEMAYVKTVIVAAALVALCAELSTAACICSCGSARRQYAADVAAAGAGDEYASASASSGEASSDSWTNIPSNAVITSSSYNDDSCGRCEIRMPDEAPLPIGIVQHRPTCAQHLSYNIEVPVEQAKPIVPSYHSVSVEVPIRQKQSVSFSHLPYSVEVPVENAPCQKLENLNVQIAVPVRERQTVSYSHLPYSVEVPVEKHGSRLTNLKAQVDRVVLPHRETCLPPNNGPAPTAEVHYVAVPAIGPCPSPISLLGLPKSSATFNYDVSSGVVASGASGSSSGSSSGCRCPCDD